ncbi:hypothetical protein [Clostridium sp. C8]|jgi:hypothetical protein|uniref:hypothetical protein n=1 Tax=Clostridium sp. C8 TaxID=1667357 RepID=UPI00062E5050|nr:hypothetical protein [Clostridium sp. C8]KLE16783.1 hypothetical protein AAT22_04550 [Clostridium sp. C8]
MKFNFEKNLRIVNELMTYLHKLGCSDINVNLHTEESYTNFIIWGKTQEINDLELFNLNKLLNTKRQHELEEYYWSLGGDCELDEELSLVGMMVDTAEIKFNDGILTLNIFRSHS